MSELEKLTTEPLLKECHPPFYDDAVGDEIRRRLKKLEKCEAALKAYMFCEQTNGGKNPHKVGTNRHRAFELGRAALEDRG